MPYVVREHGELLAQAEPRHGEVRHREDDGGHGLEAVVPEQPHVLDLVRLMGFSPPGMSSNRLAATAAPIARNRTRIAFVSFFMVHLLLSLAAAGLGSVRVPTRAAVESF